MGLRLIPVKEYTRIKRLSRYLSVTSETIYYGKPLTKKIKNKVVTSILI